MSDLCQVTFAVGVKNASDFPGFVPDYVRPLSVRVLVRSAERHCQAILKTSIEL